MLDNAIIKRMTYVENIFNSTHVELEQAHSYLRRLVIQNVEIKAKI